MAEGKIAVRYARALFEAALEQGVLDKVRNDIDGILALDSDVAEFRDLLESPILNTVHKKEIFDLMLGEKIDDLSLRFIFLMTDKKREAFLPSACRVFIDMFKKEKGIKSALVTAAGSIHAETAERIKSTLEKHYECIIELGIKEKPELIGGFVLRVEDQQLDASVASQLKKIEKGLYQSIVT